MHPPWPPTLASVPMAWPNASRRSRAGSPTGRFVKVRKKGSESSITNACGDTIMQAAFPSVKRGSKAKPSAPKKAFERARSFTGRLRKSSLGAGRAVIGGLLDIGS